MDKHLFNCPCMFGLESVLSGEIKRLGGENIVTTDGKVSFSGNTDMIARANINLRTAERVLLVLGSFKATSFSELFDKTKELPWERYILKDYAFPVKGYSLNSKLFSIPDCQKIIKKAIVSRLSEKYRISWFEETGALAQVQFSIFKDTATLMIDTSGYALHKRGYRKVSNLAPLKETLAAGIIDFARVRSGKPVYDPFCGSGTFLIESALRATNTAPGLLRPFQAMRWNWIDKKIWFSAKDEARDNITPNPDFVCFGSDIDPEAVNLTLENARAAGVEKYIRVSVSDIKDFSPKTREGIIFSNPPYGERLLDIKAAENIYKTMGKVFPDENFSKYIISANEDFESLYGKKANKNRKLFNGSLRCRVYMYY